MTANEPFPYFSRILDLFFLNGEQWGFNEKLQLVFLIKIKKPTWLQPTSNIWQSPDSIKLKIAGVVPSISSAKSREKPSVISSVIDL